MTTDKLEQHKESVRQLLAAFEQDDLETIGQLTSPEVYTQIENSLKNRAFSEHTLKIQQLIAEGDTVVVRVLSSGRHTGEFLGVPATGRRWKDNDGILIYTFADGLIVNTWMLFNRFLHLEKLGIKVTLSA
ncbi:MAG: ester cyclase [Chloroflexota bacterium]